MTTDYIRGHHNYGLSFHFGLVQGFSNDGRAFGLVMQEGIGDQYTGKEKASEDHISINGEVFKLDKIIMDVQLDQERTDAIGERAISVHMKTIEDESAKFADRKCVMTFKSDALFREGFNLVFLAYKRDYWVGKYDISCTIEG